ncbi:MAG: nucleotidyltransferase domain-containing protein [Parabacteroides sp.]|nr:nucleotidyltransferase domain-containing protein [Parabacteroides sp.]
MKTKAEYIRLLQNYMLENASKYGISRMGIFGSVARGENTENSDVDIYVEGELHGFFALSGIKSDLEELLECPVDIVRLREKMDQFFKNRILKEGIYV